MILIFTLKKNQDVPEGLKSELQLMFDYYYDPNPIIIIFFTLWDKKRCFLRE